MHTQKFLYEQKSQFKKQDNIPTCLVSFIYVAACMKIISENNLNIADGNLLQSRGHSRDRIFHRLDFRETFQSPILGLPCGRGSYNCTPMRIDYYELLHMRMGNLRETLAPSCTGIYRLISAHLILYKLFEISVRRQL